METKSLVDSTMWLLMGSYAICREAVSEANVLSLPGVQKATHAELLAAYLVGQTYFPWGELADYKPGKSPLWEKCRMGNSGLFHSKWFVTDEGVRYGGAENVADSGDASRRFNMFTHGGPGGEPLRENEGYAVRCGITGEERRAYRLIQNYAAKRVVADGGRIIVSRQASDQTFFVGFVGRCLVCPSQTLISFPALKAEMEIEGVKIEHLPEFSGYVPEFL